MESLVSAQNSTVDSYTQLMVFQQFSLLSDTEHKHLLLSYSFITVECSHCVCVLTLTWFIMLFDLLLRYSVALWMQGNGCVFGPSLHGPRWTSGDCLQYSTLPCSPGLWRLSDKPISFFVLRTVFVVAIACFKIFAYSWTAAHLCIYSFNFEHVSCRCLWQCVWEAMEVYLASGRALVNCVDSVFPCGYFSVADTLACTTHLYFKHLYAAFYPMVRSLPA